MKQDNYWENRLLDYIDGGLTEAQRQEVEAQLEQSTELQALFEQLKVLTEGFGSLSEPSPSPKVDEAFYQMLDQHTTTDTTKARAKTSRPRFSYYRQIAAAVALLILGAGGGYFLSSHYNGQEEISNLKREMEQTKKLVLEMLHQQSTSGRIKAVNQTYNLPSGDREIAEALLKTLNTDESVNVRLAAMDALLLLSSELQVRAALVASLGQQKNPIVQIALIHALIEMRERQAIPILQELIEKSDTFEKVKEEAQIGLFKIS